MLLGYLLGRGFIFSVVTLVLLYHAALAILQTLANAYLNYRSRHPHNPANERRNTLIFWGTWASFIIFCCTYHYLDSTFHFTK